MGLGSLFRTGVKLAQRYGPQAGKALGQINEGSRKFGTILQAGRKFGEVINQASNGKVGNSKFGRDANKLMDKADTITNRVGAESAEAQREIGKGLEKIRMT